MAVCSQLYPERLPHRAVLVGVEGRSFQEFADMTPEVRAGVGRARAEVRRLLE